MDLREIDFTALKKGSIITTATLEKVVEARSGTPEYALGCLNLKQQIAAHIKRATLEVVTVIIRKGQIEVLTDAQAAAYNRRAGILKLRGYGRAHRRNLGVDTSRLDYTQKEEHDRTLINQSKVLQAINAARRQCRPQPQPTVRNVPGLPGNGTASQTP